MDREQPFSPIKPAGIRDWLNRASELGFIAAHEADRLVEENERTQARLQEYGLPSFTVYGIKDSIDEFISIVPEEVREHEKFLVRCAPRDPKDARLKIQRTLNVTFTEAVEFVNQLPGGKEQYTVELREYWDPDYGGTVIGNGQGKVTIEMIADRHAAIDRATAQDLRHGGIDTRKGDLHFQYQGNPTAAEQEVMMEALRHLVPVLTREKLEELKLYTEFVYKAGKGYRFIDISDRDFWTAI